MEDEKIGERVLEEPGKVDQEKQEHVVTDYLYVKENRQLAAGKVLFLDDDVVEGEQQVDQAEHPGKQVQEPIGKGILQAEADKKEGKENAYSCDPAQQDEPADDSIEVRVLRRIDL
jgi:hypothetical protein